jgi:transposase-like protein
MVRKKKRQFTPEEKLQILEVARHPNTTVAEVLRKHQVDATTFYRWEQQAKDAVITYALEASGLVALGPVVGADTRLDNSPTISYI